MDEALLPHTSGLSGYVEELKMVNRIAIPMIITTVGQYLIRVSPIFMLGHLGELQLSGVSIGTSFSNVTGFSIVFGMSGALETLCGQAFGAKQYQRLGVYAYGAVMCLFLVCLPIAFFWIFTDKVLVFAGQDPEIASEAGKYMIWLIPTLFPYAILQSQVRFLLTQSLILPMLVSTVAAITVQLPLCWVFVFKLNMATAGAALSIGIAYWLNVILLAFYVKYSDTCKACRVSFSFFADAVGTIGEFFRFALPAAVMVCLEWWAYELIILLSGLSPNPKLETSVLSICFTITSLHYHVPYSFGAAASTRVANELGAGNPRAAKVALLMVLLISVSEFVLASMTLFLSRSLLGYVFSNEMEVVDYIKHMTPLLCVTLMTDSTQAVLSGVARGSGWQHIGAYVNLGAFYLVGIPVSLVLGFALHLRGMGLWGGLISGSSVQCILLVAITARTNWEKQSIEARKRIFQDDV